MRNQPRTTNGVLTGKTARASCAEMIARLRGKVIEAYPNRLVVDVHGVGYEVFTFDPS